MWPLFGPNSAWWLILLWSHFLSHQKFRLLKCGVHEAMCRFFSPLRTHLYFFFSLSWHQVSAGNLEMYHNLYIYQFDNQNGANWNWSNPIHLRGCYNLLKSSTPLCKENGCLGNNHWLCEYWDFKRYVFGYWYWYSLTYFLLPAIQR